MLIIFCFSAQTGGESSRLSDAVAGALQGGAAKDNGLIWLIRKSAHFIEYFLLGGLLFSAFYLTGRDKKGKPFLCAAAAGVLYAALDEWHQAFVPGRSARVADVVLDGAGVLCGAALALVCWFFWQKRRKKGRDTETARGGNDEKRL